MTGSELLGGSPVVALDSSMMVPALALVGALLVGAVVVAFVRRWQLHNKSLGPSASEQLAEFRRLYEQGGLSEEEFKRLRTILGGEIRKAVDLPVPARPPEQAAPSTPSPEPPATPGPEGPKPPGESVP